MTSRGHALLPILVCALVGCSSKTAEIPEPIETPPLILAEWQPPAEVPEPDSLLQLITFSSPLDTLDVDIPDIPDSTAEAGRERVLAQEEVVTYDIPVDLNVRVLTFIEAYTGKQAEWFGRAIKRSGRVLPMIQEIFAEEGIPLDLAYMAHVESAYRYNARSRAGAIGMWQFIRGTGRHYNLLCNGLVDERLDPERATRAAAHYLRDLYAEFGDWYLAMAAYNTGAGRVRRGIRRTGSRNFWDLAQSRYLVRETRNYVPAILAAIVISKSPEKFGFDIEPDPPLEYDSVEVETVTHLDVVAKCCEVPASVIRALNPALITLQTPPGHHPYAIRVPRGSTETFLAAIEDIAPEDRMLYVRHRVRRGETLSVLARHYATTVGAIQQSNRMGRSTMIRQGSTLLIPTSGAGPGLALASLAGPGEKVSHRVRRGETLGQIARAYGTSVRAIQLWNHISDPHRVRAGQSLVVYAGVRQAAPFNQTDSVVSPRPTSPGEAATSQTALSVHHVRRGDSLWEIAREHGMTVEELRRANPKLKSSNVIRPGDRLMVSNAAPGGRLIVHRVSRGETLWDIADRYGTTVTKIRSWNGMGRRESLIRPGDEIKLYR